jgi:hypothetical protein
MYARDGVPWVQGAQQLSLYGHGIQRFNPDQIYWLMESAGDRATKGKT